MIPKICHQVHFGGPMNAETVRWTSSVKKLHPEWTHHLWDEKRLFMEGMNLDDLRRRFGSWAGVSNYVRLHALLNYGGLYLDTDIECLKPFDELMNYNAFAAFQDDIDGGRICNAVAAARPGHPWIEFQYSNAETELNADAASGVYLMTKAPRGDLEILPTNFFYPWSYNTPRESRKPAPESYCAHYWIGSWTKK